MFNFWGKGLLQGLSVTARTFFRKNVTEEYPLVKTKMPSQWRGSFAFEKEKCIACGICVDTCLMKAIVLENLKARIDSDWCCGCLICRDNCPTNSIEILEVENGY